MPASDDELDESSPQPTSAGEQSAPRPSESAPAASDTVHRAKAQLEQAELEAEAADDAAADAEGAKAVAEFRSEAAESDPDLPQWKKVEARESTAQADRALRRAVTRFERATAKVIAAEKDLALAETQAHQTATSAEANEPPPEPPRFATVELFVEKFVLPNWVHKYVSGRVRWCAQWWEHAEAITRMEAMWEAFEVMRLQPPPSFSTWLRDHFDVHMRMLTDPEGVFYNCDVEENQHNPVPAWTLTPAPQGMFAEIAAAQVQRTAGPAETPQPGPGLADQRPTDLSAHHGKKHTHTKGARP